MNRVRPASDKVRKRPDSALWSALEAAELEEAEIGDLAVARGIVDARGLAALKRRGVARALEERLGSAAALALRDEARRAVAPCPSCGVGFVRVGRPDDARCVHCGKGPADTTEQPIEVPSSSTPMIIMDDSSADVAERKPKPRLPALPEGARVADYAIDREIGRGGMGVVYRAWRDEAPVALKVMAPGVSAQARARFVREAGSASRLDHPAIARVLGSGNSDHGPWIAMELVQGLSLSEHLRRFPITLDRALEIAERVARAMDHAHRRGVVHRDLKPGNVLIARDGAVKVVDFGLAKDLDANAVLTTDGMAIGTPGYMSPEQVAPKADAVGVAADVHAIGTILYELLTGTRPFRGATARDVFVAILSEAPEPLAARRPDVAFPSGLQEIITRALAKRPADRYLTAVALADDIASVRRGQQPLNAREETRSNDPALALRWGDRIGPYELRFAIGVGSASVVFKAVAADGSAVAVKVLRPRDRERLRRFEREVRLLAHFTREGKGFIPLLGHGVAAGGTWLAMPFVAGGTLRDRLERGPLATERAVSVVLTVAKAMARAHEEGITHRDLKPENILFTEEGEPLVADLGLARPAQGGDMSDWTDSVTVSREGRFMGSAGYAAPEQLDDAHKAGPPADVFALGAILYECVSGVPAIQAPNAIVLAARLAKADHKPLGVVAPEAPPWLVHVVERALAGAESERWRDAGELARALELQEAGLPAPGAADLARKALARVKKMVRKPRGRAESGD